jgi:branched-chain amino acid transport system ATP-binding protein
MLVVEQLRSGYTMIDVLHGVTLQVPTGSIIGVLGANGAGKTALLRAISGLNPVRSGRVVFDDEELSRSSTDAIVRRKVIHMPQGRMLFGGMSVRENLELGAFLIGDRAVFNERLANVYELFPILKERAGQLAAYLSGGEQQMLALGRAWMSSPKLMLLDEPSLGLAPKIFDTILDTVRKIHATGASILIAEQNARKVLRLADHCYVLENGKVAFHGSGPELLSDERIGRTYLGAGH